MAQTFTTRDEAMRFIAAALPKATSANPRYLTKSDRTLSQWLTVSVGFADGAVTMQERYTQTKAGKTTDGAHKAAFGFADVAAAEFSSAEDVTPAGEPAQGILFTCAKPGCIAAMWGSDPSQADKTDIYVQDAATRAKLLAAFRRIQTP